MDNEEILEAKRLEQQIDNLARKINRIVSENAILLEELNTSVNNIGVLIDDCSVMEQEVYGQIDGLSKDVGKTEIDTKEVFDALNELTVKYFTFKSLSTASKNITQFTDEYNTTFSYYNELRRITLGYVIGLDSHIISSESARKKVEKAYLQNSDYWLAYSISSVMLWASDEKEAAGRAVSKSLSLNYFNTCLFLLLINLRFNRIDAARKWYVSYLDRVDSSNLGDEWQYLLQAYLSGAFGADKDFQEQIAACFKKMFAQAEVTTVNLENKFIYKALEFAQSYIHATEYEYGALRKTCSEYGELKKLLSSAEKNAKIARYYNDLIETEIDEGRDLAQRIENVLYSLINNYDEDELKIVKKLRYNEAVVEAKGNVSAAQAKYNAMFADEGKNKSLGDLLLHWAFDEDSSRTNIIVKRFTISFVKEWIAKGLALYAEKYRREELEKVTIIIDDCRMTCDENDYESLKPTLEKHYDKDKWKSVMRDKFILVYGALCAAALIILIIMPFLFSEIALTIAILIGLIGSFLLWRRIVDLEKILQEKKRQGILKLKHVLDELGQWRNDYREADIKHADMMHAIEKF